jgi:hypothetical protein
MAIVASGQLTLIDLNDSKQLVAYIGSSQQKTVIYNPNTGVYVPNYSSANQVLTPQLFIAGTATDVAGNAKSTKWFYQTNSAGSLTEITVNGGGYTLGTGAVKTLTISSNVLASNNSMTYICELIYTDPDTGFDVVTKSEIELVKVTNGSDGADGSNGVNAIIAVLSNESHVVPTDSAGNNGNFTGANTTMSIFNGSTDDSANWTVTAGTPVGLTGSLSGKTYTVTAMSADTAHVDLTATRSGYASITKRFALSKSKQGTAGSNGTTPTTYWLISSVPAISKSQAGAYTPTSVTFQAKSQTGTASPANYSGRFIIADSTDGTTFTDRVTSTTNEASKSYTVGANVKSVRVRLYLAGGTTNLLDEQIIPVVTDGTDGSNGVNAVLATVWTPDGNTLKNSTGTLKATVDVYSGTTEVTPTAFKWYIQDPTATTSSGGDTDGGAGWRLLNATYNAGVTGYTTATITIPASAIAGVESFMCIATYGGKKYKDVCTVIDVTDPILVTIIGLSTFKNGQGSTELTAKLYRNGAEIDSAGTGHTYTWSLYKADGTKDTAFTATGKTITVNATSVDSRANIICEVSN